MSDWADYEFIIVESEEVSRACVDRTGWELVRFEVADDEPDPPHG
jgi:hypothetical protein